MTAPARCGWCGRQTDDYIIRDLDTDHGPLRILWCAAWGPCSDARAAQPPQPTAPSRVYRP